MNLIGWVAMGWVREDWWSSAVEFLFVRGATTETSFPGMGARRSASALGSYDGAVLSRINENLTESGPFAARIDLL